MFIYKLHCLYILIILHVFTDIITTHNYDYRTFTNVHVRGLAPTPPRPYPHTATIKLRNKLRLSYQKPCGFSVHCQLSTQIQVKYVSTLTSTHADGLKAATLEASTWLQFTSNHTKKKGGGIKECKGLYHIQK